MIKYVEVAEALSRKLYKLNSGYKVTTGNVNSKKVVLTFDNSLIELKVSIPKSEVMEWGEANGFEFEEEEI